MNYYKWIKTTELCVEQTWSTTVHYLKLMESGDPARAKQTFRPLNINMLCCRYWWLTEWNCPNHSFPYWRLYWNKNPGASISLHGRVDELLPDRILLIPPHTPYTSQLNRKQQDGYRLQGEPVAGIEDEKAHCSDGAVCHLFAHFNLGFPYDAVSPKIYRFDLDDTLEPMMYAVRNQLLDAPVAFNIGGSMHIYALVIELAARIPESDWPAMMADERIRTVMNFINEHDEVFYSNAELARQVHMATNAFARLFRQKTGQSPRQYLLDRRIEKSCILLHHTTDSIDKIALTCGFCDRYYFSRVFKKKTGTTPAAYRQNFMFA